MVLLDVAYASVLGIVLRQLLGGFWLAAAALLLGLAVVFWRRRKKKSVASSPFLARPDEETTRPVRGRTDGVMSGIRVLEIADTVAGPMVGRVFADLGAEVFKVEPPKGDMWRNFIKTIQPASRRHSVVFDPVNTGKASIVIDYSTTEGIALIKQLLRDCDILVTNVRLDSLRKAGLHYEQIHREFPQLIYASLTAWGSHGPDYMNPGYDIGAFYAASGMSGLTCPLQGNYSSFTTSFGDATTSTALSTAAIVALAHRERTGRGQLVSTSLLKMGIWCMSSELIAEANRNSASSTDGAPDYGATAKVSPLFDAYTSKDGVMMQLCGDSWPGKHEESCSFESLRAQIKTMLAAEIPVRYTLIPSIADVHFKLVPNENFEHAEIFCKEPIGTQDASQMHRLPFDMSAFPNHGPAFRAPLLGEHSASIKRDGWSIRDEPKLFGSETPRETKPYAGIVCWEWADTENIVPQVCGTELYHFGASVSHRSSGIHSALPQLCDGKELLSSNDLDELNLINCHVLITNLASEIALEELHEKFPHLIIADVTPFGRGGSTFPRTSLGPFTSAGGMCHLHGTGGKNAEKFPSFPKHLGDFITAQHLMVGITAALLHQSRSGNGQIVSVNFLRSGLFGFNAVVTPANQLMQMYNDMPSASNLHMGFFVPTANSFRTKDGFYITLLGADFFRHLPRTMKAFGLGKSFYLSLAAAGIKALVTKSTLLERFGVVMQRCNSSFAEMMHLRTFAEWKPIFAQHDVWYTMVRMLPQVLAMEQAQEIGVFSTPGQISMPIKCYGFIDEKPFEK